MKRYTVVDASLAVKWVLREPYSGDALALADEWAATETTPTAPCLLLFEATNVLYRRALSGQISQSQAKELLAGLLNMGIEIKESPQLHIQALELAQELQMPAIYDTHYLALSEMLECDMWTADEKFFNSVKGLYPQVKWVGNFQDRER